MLFAAHSVLPAALQTYSSVITDNQELAGAAGADLARLCRARLRDIELEGRGGDAQGCAAPIVLSPVLRKDRAQRRCEDVTPELLDRLLVSFDRFASEATILMELALPSLIDAYVFHHV